MRLAWLSVNYLEKEKGGRKKRENKHLLYLSNMPSFGEEGMEGGLLSEEKVWDRKVA